MPLGSTLAGVAPSDQVLYVFLGTLSTVALPVPEEAMLLAAGYAARLGRAPLAACLGAAWAAVMLGDCVAYGVGRWLLAPLLATRVGRKMFPEARVAWAERVIQGHGARAVALARFAVGLRGFLYFAIGASRYPFARFVAVNAAAGLVEVGALVGLGAAVGDLRARVGIEVDLVAAAVLLASLVGPVAVRSRVR